jgi:hypothetical protein
MQASSTSVSIPERPPRAYVVGASRERLPTIRERLRKDGFDVCGHCDAAREFCPPRDASFVLLITDMGCHAALKKAREFCRTSGLPCVGGVWRTWSTTRERLSSLGVPSHRKTHCPPSCPLRDCCGGASARQQRKN